MIFLIFTSIVRTAPGVDGTGYLDIAYGFSFSYGQYQVIENGVTKTSSASHVATDVFSIVRTGTSVEYQKNSIPVYTSLVASTSSRRR